MDFLFFYFFHPVMDADFVLWAQNIDTILRTSEALYLYFSTSPSPTDLNVQVSHQASRLFS